MIPVGVAALDVVSPMPAILLIVSIVRAAIAMSNHVRLFIVALVPFLLIHLGIEIRRSAEMSTWARAD